MVFYKHAFVTAKIILLWYVIAYVSLASLDGAFIGSRVPCLFISEIVGSMAQ